MTRRLLVVFFGGAAVLLVPWTIGLTHSLPCRYVSAHWGVAWAGFDTGLAVSLALTGLAVLRGAAWLDRAAVATATLLVADAWFDVLTAGNAAAVALASAEALAVELPVAALCLWVARRFTPPPTKPERDFATKRVSPRLFDPASTDFVISKGGVSGAAFFRLATEDGTMAGWNPNVDPLRLTGSSTRRASASEGSTRSTIASTPSTASPIRRSRPASLPSVALVILGEIGTT